MFSADLLGGPPHPSIRLNKDCETGSVGVSGLAYEVEGIASFSHMAAIADFLATHKVASPIVGPKHHGIESKPISPAEKGELLAAEIKDYQHTVDGLFNQKAKDPEFIDAIGQILVDYVNSPPIIADRPMLPGWDAHFGKLPKIASWREFYARSEFKNGNTDKTDRGSATTPVPDVVRNTLNNTDGFLSVLGMKSKDSDWRLDKVNSIQVAYVLSKIITTLEIEHKRTTPRIPDTPGTPIESIPARSNSTAGTDQSVFRGSKQ